MLSGAWEDWPMDAVDAHTRPQQPGWRERTSLPSFEARLFTPAG